MQTVLDTRNTLYIDLLLLNQLRIQYRTIAKSVKEK